MYIAASVGLFMQAEMYQVELERARSLANNLLERFNAKMKAKGVSMKCKNKSKIGKYKEKRGQGRSLFTGKLGEVGLS